MASVLTIGGIVVNRYLGHILINRLTHSLDSPDTLEFTELTAPPPGAYALEQAVTLTVDGTLEFSGWIFSRAFGELGTGCPWVGYRCLDLRYGVSLIPVTASDGTGIMRFNRAATDDQFVQGASFKSAGEILADVFAQHSTQLGSIGVATDATTDGQLAALTVVPPEPVLFYGNDLWSQCIQLLVQWYGSKYAIWITPDGKIRVTNTTTLTAITLTLDLDPIIVGSLSEETSECFTQVCLRGAADIEGYVAKLSLGTLIDPNNPTPEDTWTERDFLYPEAGFSAGSVTAQTSDTVTIKSDSATETWPANYWSGIQGKLFLTNTAITGMSDFTGGDSRWITANEPLAAGGTSMITVDRPFGSPGMTNYEIRGTPAGKSECYRKYTFKNRTIAQHLAQRFQHSVFWSPHEGAGMATLTPQAEIISDPSVSPSHVQWPLPFEVIPYDGTTDGYIRFLEPTVHVVAGNGGPLGAPLFAGGASVIKPLDIIVLVPYSRGALQAIAPAPGGTPGYSGTAYTRFGIQRTLYRDYPDWLDKNDLSMMQELAAEILDTTSHVVVEGSITYFGKYTTGLVSGSWPFALNLAKAWGGVTSFEAMAAPVRSVVLNYPQAGAVPWVTVVNFSTKRQQFSGDRLYRHPMYDYEGSRSGGLVDVLAVGAPLAGIEAAGLPVGMGGFAGETGTLPTSAGQPFTGAAGGPLGFSPVNQPGPGGANLPGFGTAQTGVMPDLGRIGGEFLAAPQFSAQQQQAQAARAEAATEAQTALMGQTQAAAGLSLPPGMTTPGMVGTPAMEAGNPYAAAQQAFAGLGMNVMGREIPLEFSRPRPIPLPEAQRPGEEFPGVSPRLPFSRLPPPQRPGEEPFF